MSDVDTNSDRGIHLESVTPMAPSEPPRDDEATFSSDDAGLRDAAAAREEAALDWSPEERAAVEEADPDNIIWLEQYGLH